MRGSMVPIQPAQGWSRVSRGAANAPLGHGGVGGAGTLRLTGDATASRCPGPNILPLTQSGQPSVSLVAMLGGNGGVCEGRIAGGDATGDAQRVPLAKISPCAKAAAGETL